MITCGDCGSLMWWDEDEQDWFCAPCETANLDKAKGGAV